MGLCNLKRQYLVIYKSDKKDASIVHHDSVGKPNMEFCMHTSGLHFFDPSKPILDTAFIFVDTVTGNKQRYSQRQLRVLKKPVN